MSAVARIPLSGSPLLRCHFCLNTHRSVALAQTPWHTRDRAFGNPSGQQGCPRVAARPHLLWSVAPRHQAKKLSRPLALVSIPAAIKQSEPS